ncbi:MAG TPA: type II secretion system minor pseudopilin GspJ [Casimicrobiaceae bacterium]|nr:type II secretion system minor pseudopilin GspJ [Casimicrobiaceae bacterium]
MRIPEQISGAGPPQAANRPPGGSAAAQPQAWGDHTSDAGRCARGFTLVEALVAVAILALVAMIAWRATAAMTDGEVRLSEQSARWQHLDALLARMEADMRTAIPRGVRHGGETEPAWYASPDDAAGNTALVFTRAGPDAIDEPGSGGQRVGYRLHDGHVEVVYWPRLDNAAATVPATYALVDGIAGFRVLQLTGDGRWSDRWPFLGASAVPRGVRIQIVLADGSAVERWLALR